MAMLILTARTDLTHGYAYCIADDNVKALLDEQKKVLAKFSYEDEEVMNVHYFGQMPEQSYAELQEHDERFADFKQCRTLSEFISHLPESKLFWQRHLQMLRQAANPTKTTGRF